MSELAPPDRDPRPAWIREIDLALPVTAQFLISGNIADLHLNAVPGHTFARSAQAVVRCFAVNGYDLVYRFDPLAGIVLEHVAPTVVSTDFFPDAHLGKVTAATPSRLADLIRRSVSQVDRLVGVLIEDASALWADDASAEIRALMLVGRRLADGGTTSVQRETRRSPLSNCVVWFADRENDAPAWLATADSTRMISIPRPNLGARRDVALHLVPALPGGAALTAEQRSGVAELLASSTEGLTVRAMQNIVTLAADGGIPPERIDEAARSYLAGVLESPWQDPLLLDRLSRAHLEIGTRVLGQDRAVERSLDILLRSAVGLTGAQSGGRIGRPQGILFFAGPTGVGKTELARALAKTLFGTDDAYTRFDMSEFSAEHSEARLIGAPPGYVGHSAGGELTNAVRQRPFSILLFDEIEKAHPRILDKFLQILEDGRLTDGSGSTVYFSECVIVFTSNIGAGTAGDDADPAGQEARIRTAIEHHFTDAIGRPELLNRIGDNIIVFDSISPEVGVRLVRKYVDSVVELTDQRLGVRLTVDPIALERIERFALTKLRFGGRGISAAVETALVNPLTRAILGVDRPARYVLRDLAETGDRWTARLERSSDPA